MAHTRDRGEPLVKTAIEFAKSHSTGLPRPPATAIRLCERIRSSLLKKGPVTPPDLKDSRSDPWRVKTRAISIVRSRAVSFLPL
jgi:hypothetical protein